MTPGDFFDALDGWFEFCSSGPCCDRRTVVIVRHVVDEYAVIECCNCGATWAVRTESASLGTWTMCFTTKAGHPIDMTEVLKP